MWFISLRQSASAWAACLLMVGAAPTWVIAQPPTLIGAFDPPFTAFRSAIFAGLSEQIATLPLPIGGGFTYRRDPTLGVFTRKTDSFGIDHGFLWQGGLYFSLDVEGAAGTIASGINDAGVIVGEFADTLGSHGWSAR
jgi:hypothetical protein